MRSALVRFVFVACLAAAWLVRPFASSQQMPELHWYKGNLHTHTINSDGDSSPDTVARWYKEHRYHFLALTDHNYFTDPQGLNAFLAAQDRFLLLTGEEVTSRYDDKPVHVNAFRLKSTIDPAFGSDVVETLRKNVEAIRAHGAIPSLNHPNFVWGVSAGELEQIDRLNLFEVYNGHPTTNDFGGGGSVGTEGIWDHLLTAGRRMYGIAVDDAHVFKSFSPQASNPGRGWIHVRSAELTSEAILAAVEQGDFYASTGVELEEVERTGRGLVIHIKERNAENYSVRFIGPGGKLLEESFDNPAEYQMKPGDAYVRATVLDSNGRAAWVQPIFSDR